MGCGSSKDISHVVDSASKTSTSNNNNKPLSAKSSSVESTKINDKPPSSNPSKEAFKNPPVSKAPAQPPVKISSGSNHHGNQSLDDSYRPGYSSGASTASNRSNSGDLDDSNHSTSSRGRNKMKGVMVSSSSILGLDKMIDDRRAEGDLKNNIVHIEVPFGKPIEEVYDGVHDGPVLGSGISGLVRLATHKATKVKYAVKCLDLGLVETDEGLQQLREEIAIMCQLDHPNIVRLEEVYESHNEIYLVQELCLGGELFDRLDEQPDYHYTEAQCARLVKQMLCSVRYIHSKGIIHRDLKLENFLFSNRNPDSELKMIDFGLSKHFSIGEVQHEAVGTPYTVAPEVIKGSYDERCDVWAIGVITFLLLSGESPFGGCGGPEPLMQVRQNILSGDFAFEPEDIWQNVSQQAIDFITSLLVLDPNLRPTARACQKAPWLREWAQKNRNKEDNKLNPNVVKALVNFKEYSDMRKLLCEVLSFTLLPDQISDLRKEFEKLDTDGSGEISLAGLKKILMQNAGAGSLGALTEEEVEDIFNAMRVRKTETRIHWHEFIAAGLSQCKVDERNLQLAFDRLDSDHKGYITFENVMDLMGSDAVESEDAMRRMWGESMKDCKSQNARITYDDFLLLMKGQTKQDINDQSTKISTLNNNNRNVITKKPLTSTLMHPPSSQLGVLHEVTSCGDSHTSEDYLNRSTSAEEKEVASISETQTMIPNINPQMPLIPPGGGMLGLIANSPIRTSLFVGEDIEGDDAGPLMMDDEGEDEQISNMADDSWAIMNDTRFNKSESFLKTNTLSSPPLSPKKEAPYYSTPKSQKEKFSPKRTSNSGGPITEFPPPVPNFMRLRSKSVDENDKNYDTDDHLDDDKDVTSLFVSDVRRAMALPEHDHTEKDINTLIKDESKTPLVVNRKLYRAHRQMRLSVLDASKRFEEEQIKRTKERMKRESHGGKGHFGAGLVMRHGHTKELSSDSIKQLIKEKQKEQQPLVEKANRRGGRGRRSRKKTISDMSGMLACANDATFNAPAPTVEMKRSSLSYRPASDMSTNELKLHDTAQRKPTVPGQFRKTQDPFHQMKSLLDSTPEERSQQGGNKKTGNKEVEENWNRDDTIKVSISDGKLNDLDGSVCSGTSSKYEESPQNPSTSNSRVISASPSWPPPPPL